MSNYETYKKLKEKYKIAYGSKVWDSYERQWEDIDMDDYDIVIDNAGVGYAHAKYRIVKNNPNLSSHELALLCDGGNLCFGYRTEGNIIIVHTD